MECPKCHKKISDNTTICPFCHKVLALTCPNCRTLNHSAVCTECGYIILEKCSKCGKLTPTNHKNCKCGFSTATSIAYNECEVDEFATVIIKFGALRKIRTLLKSQELYAKFLVKLKNLITAQLKDMDGHVIRYGDVYTVNFNKELSFATSVNKALRLSLKLATAFSGLNLNLMEQLGTPLKLTITIMKKNAEEFLINKMVESNVKLMIIKPQEKKYLKGMQVILDQYCQDCIKDYKTDSLYSLEMDGASVMFYEVLLDNYIISPSEGTDEPAEISDVKKNKLQKSEQLKNDLYALNVFDINAKCQFAKSTLQTLPAEIDFNKKIISLRCDKENSVKTSDIVKMYSSQGMSTVYVSCTEEMNYKPWGFLEKLFKACYNLPVASGLIKSSFEVPGLNTIKEFLMGEVPKASSPEDARFSFLELFIDFLSAQNNLVIIVDSFENIDDTSMQALDLYFNKFQNNLTNFVFITTNKVPVHSKIKNLIHQPLYKEITLLPSSIEDIISEIKEDASDFLQSFYFEKIKDNFNGSKLYFDHAVQYLKGKDILVTFENKMLIRTKRSAILPVDLPSLIRTRLKTYGKYQDASMILAYSVFLGERLDFETLTQLGINNVSENAYFLEESGFTFTIDNNIYINNYDYVKPVIQSSLKQEVQEVIAKTILAKLNKVLDNTSILLLMGILSMYKEESMLLWKNAQISIEVGDYDAYLKNCLGYLSLIDKFDDSIPSESIENNKKDIFQNILMSLYSYSPSKIYSIENVLLMDAMQSGDNEKIIKLSNLMLQGALITANYTEASVLLHNILSRMPNPSLIVDGAINTRFLLLSLVNIEILFNIGDYRSCIELAEEILKIVKPGIIPDIKPVNFSTNLFVTHLMDTFRLAVFAKLLANDNDIEKFCGLIQAALDSDLPDKDCILTIKDYLAGKDYAPSKTEDATSFSKIIYLILQEISTLENDYKAFAQNIYQAKLLAVDLSQKQLEYLCEILIGYAYSQIGVSVKAEAILNDVLEQAENSAIFNIVVIARYVIAKHKIKTGDYEGAMMLVNDTLADIQKYDNQAVIFNAMFERLFIEIVDLCKINTIDIYVEIKKLLQLSSNGELERIVRSSDFTSVLKKEDIPEKSDFIQEKNDLDELSDAFSDSDSLGTEAH